jgi:hypothetical protein
MCFTLALLLFARMSGQAKAQTPVPAATRDGDAYAYFIGDWTCRTGFDNIARKSYTFAGGGVEMRSTWEADGGADGGTIAERYGGNVTNLTASSEYRGTNGVRTVADYTSSGWQDGTLVFVGAFSGNIGHGRQAMIYTRIDENTFERRFVVGPPAQVTSVERCERGHDAPRTAPTMPPS